VAKRTLAQRDETLKLVRDRVSAGLDTRLELRQSEGGLPEARQQIEALQRADRAAAQRARRAVGQPNVRRRSRRRRSTACPPAVPANIPADLLGRRADIAAARWRVEAATSDVKNAKTQFYPNVNLTAFAGFPEPGPRQAAQLGQRAVGRGPGHQPADLRRGRCAPTCAARRPTSTPPSKATTPP
jgi:outer membrane protein TolC